MLLNEMESLLIDVDQRTKHIDERVTAIGEHVTAMDERLMNVDVRVTAMDERLTHVDARVTATDERLTNVDARTSRMEQILPTLATKDDLELTWQRSKALVESVRDEVQVVAENVLRIYNRLDGGRS